MKEILFPRIADEAPQPQRGKVTCPNYAVWNLD